MIWHIFKYRVKSLIRTWEVLFWTLAFPILLSVFFYLGFGNYFEAKEKFHAIPAAVVVEQENPYIRQMLESLSGEGSAGMLEITETDKENAGQLLADGQIEGIFYMNDSLGLEFKKNGISQSILKTIADSYAQMTELIVRMAAEDPKAAGQLLEDMAEDISLNREISYTSGDMDSMLQYFYALLAMTCLYGSFQGLLNAEQLQANLSSLAARKIAAPAPRMKMILGEFAAASAMQFITVLAVIGFMQFVLKVNFGTRIFPIIFLALGGSILGVSFGFFAGCIGKRDMSFKSSVLIAVSMFLSFLSGLMVDKIKITIERSCPLLNRLNPAALIADAFYALNIYDGYERYLMNMAGILIYAGVFCTAGFLLARRKKYASL